MALIIIPITLISFFLTEQTLTTKQTVIHVYHDNDIALMLFYTITLKYFHLVDLVSDNNETLNLMSTSRKAFSIPCSKTRKRPNHCHERSKNYCHSKSHHLLTPDNFDKNPMNFLP